MYLAKTPDFLKPLAAGMVWDIQSNKQELFLTFDDGPDPEVTPQVLDILNTFNAKACFFCVGKNVKDYPELFNRIVAEGHSLGNHTFEHEKGWDTDLNEYLRSVLKCNELVQSKLFRPPYGRISRAQATALKPKYHLIMWDVLSGDFDTLLQPENCADNVVKHAKPGSIVVFHDSLKCKENVLNALPVVLETFAKQNYTFPALTAEIIENQSVKNA